MRYRVVFLIGQKKINSGFYGTQAECEAFCEEFDYEYDLLNGTIAGMAVEPDRDRIGKTKHHKH